MLKKTTKIAKNNYKLNGTQKALVIQMLADFKGNNEIIEYFKSEYDIDLTSAAITHYKHKNENDIIEVRKNLSERILAIPIANKIFRVELRQKLVADIMDKGLWYTITNKYGEHKKGNHGAVNEILDSVKSELEPDKLALTDPSGNLSLIELIKKANESNGEE
jgi:hypothetical protein